MAKEIEHQPRTIVTVRDIHQRGYYSQLVDPLVREDGWVHDNVNRDWYSPSNVISIVRFTPSKWDGNNIQPGTLCESREWIDGAWGTMNVVVINHVPLSKSYTVLMPDGSKKTVGERRIVPVMEPQNATT